MYQRAAIFIPNRSNASIQDEANQQPISWSAAKKKIAAKNTMTNTISVEIIVSRP